ncbi:Meiosis 1 arrest protein [Holothuria leucospilota]|uniref:Meiosis 1 arrest protein n=1 Tax=Holothuria leucospilota TaxID=206669 RepID=A0A9Q0YJS9_HOLLE|nr:Meiosis 1 arrest protein [Holothuria leucospilota]
MCHLLQEKELAILAKKDTPPPPSYSKVGGGVYLKPSSSRPITTPSSAGHFLILPSHGMSMLVKSVAVKELMLPSDAHEKGEPPLSDTLETVQKVLEKVLLHTNLLILSKEEASLGR